MGEPPIAPPSHGSPNVRAIITCAGCGRTLLERRDLGPVFNLNGHPCEVADYKFRPWMAVVITRVRDVEGSGRLTMADGTTIVQTRERAVICSRPCLDAVRASFTFDPSPGVVATLHVPTIRDGDDMISHLLASKGPIPDAPSDEWNSTKDCDEECET